MTSEPNKETINELVVDAFAPPGVVEEPTRSYRPKTIFNKEGKKRTVFGNEREPKPSQDDVFCAYANVFNPQYANDDTTTQ